MKKEKLKTVGAGPVPAQKGITLIALVITIIVMLILVAVTITMAVNGGLFEYAGKAGTKTNEAIANEQLLAEGKVNIDNKVYNSIDEYLGVEGIVLSDDYGHSYTVKQAGRYYFYSYTYGQNFMTVFEVTEEDGELVATKLGEYSNETGKIRGDNSQASADGIQGTCLSSSSELTPTVPVSIYGSFYISLVPGNYYFSYEMSGQCFDVTSGLEFVIKDWNPDGRMDALQFAMEPWEWHN